MRPACKLQIPAPFEASTITRLGITKLFSHGSAWPISAFQINICPVLRERLPFVCGFPLNSRQDVRNVTNVTYSPILFNKIEKLYQHRFLFFSEGAKVRGISIKECPA